MLKNLRAPFFALFALVTFVSFAGNSFAQTRRARVTEESAARARSTATNTTPAAVANSPLVALPNSDVAMLADVRRILNEAMPRALANDPARLAKANADIEDFKNKTGLDPRQFDTVAVGARFKNAGENSWKDVDSVIIAHGTFNSGALSAAARIGSNGKYREEKYKGQTLYIFNIADQVKAFGLFDIKPGEYAITTLDANTIAFGKPEMVRATLDTKAGRAARISNDTVALVGRNTNALIAYGGNVPASLAGNVRVGNDEIARSIASIKKFYGALNATNTGFDSLNSLVTNSSDDATKLSDTFAALKQFAPFLVNRINGDKGKVARDAIDNLQVNTQGNEVQIRTSITQLDLEMLLRK